MLNERETMRKLILIAALVSLLMGCEYQTKTERRVALFWKDENGGEVSKSRDIGSFTQSRKGNKVDHALRKFFDTSPRK